MKPREYKTERNANKYCFHLNSMRQLHPSLYHLHYFVSVNNNFKYVVMCEDTKTGKIRYCA